MFIRVRKPFASRLFAVGWILCALTAGFSCASGFRFHSCPVPPGDRVYDLPRGGCSDRHWITLADQPAPSTTSGCPEVLGWSEEFLFFERPRDEAGRRFCRYLWNSEKSPGGEPSLQADTQRLRQRTDLHGTVRRCGVVGTSAKTLAESNQEVLFRELRFQVGDTDMPVLANPPTVRLAVLDTYPTTDEFPLRETQTCRSSHGHGIARIARELSCDGSAEAFTACAAEIGSRLALPVIEPGLGVLDLPPSPGPDQCGRFGSPVDLALAIREEVHRPTPMGHLILNLSVGWDPELLHQGLGAEAADGLNAEELAVYAALWDAASRGVLAIAAAGNGQGGQQPGNGPLLPAGWYVEPPKTKLAPAFLPDPADPVIWSIGAIDRNGRRLPNARPGAEPPLVAYGDHAAVRFGGQSWTEPLTGSSVGAAVASSLAALAWHLQPGLDRTGVMALLESSGTPLGRNAESYRSTLKPQVRRLSVTSLLSRAWSPPKVRSDPFTIAQVIDCAQGGWENSTVTAGKIYKCLGAQAHAPIPPSPLLQPLGAVPWVQTQPGANACPSCSLGGGGGSGLQGAQAATDMDLRLEIPADWDSKLQLTDLWLEGIDPSGQKTTIWIGTPAGTWLKPSEALQVKNLPLPPDIQSAALTARVEVDGKNLSLRMPIYVDPEN
ncbi:MAG TPA: S8 family serine peptidase [Thermoanaerobaculia bacterium]|nr:S8 family serine peptidase [Thermoanaerobaculia bacterium]